jgi:hypothetical protein
VVRFNVFCIENRKNIILFPVAGRVSKGGWGKIAQMLAQNPPHYRYIFRDAGKLRQKPKKERNH